MVLVTQAYTGDIRFYRRHGRLQLLLAGGFIFHQHEIVFQKQEVTAAGRLDQLLKRFGDADVALRLQHGEAVFLGDAAIFAGAFIEENQLLFGHIQQPLTLVALQRMFQGSGLAP